MRSREAFACYEVAVSVQLGNVAAVRGPVVEPRLCFGVCGEVRAALRIPGVVVVVAAVVVVVAIVVVVEASEMIRPSQGNLKADGAQHPRPYADPLVPTVSRVANCAYWN